MTVLAVSLAGACAGPLAAQEAKVIELTLPRMPRCR